MHDLIVYVDRSRVREGKLGELEDAMDELAAFVEANEPEMLTYNVHFNAEGTRMTVVHAHDGPASLEAHFEIAGDRFAPVGEFIELETIDVYGHPGEDLVQRLEDKAATLGTGRVRVHELAHGFERIT